MFDIEKDLDPFADDTDMMQHDEHTESEREWTRMAEQFTNVRGISNHISFTYHP